MGMTNEEIIKGLQAVNEHIGKHFNEGGAWMAEFIDNAIKALEQKPNRCDSCTHSEEQDGSNCYECVKGMADNFQAQSTDADYVSREEVMKLLEKEDWADTVYGVMNLPSVKLPRPKSKWNYINEHARRYRVCSNCGYTKEDDKFYGWYFCPNCGAEMEIKNEKETC